MRFTTISPAILLAALLAWQLSPAAASPGPAASIGLYLQQGPELLPLDASTLADVPFGTTINVGDAALQQAPVILTSRNGAVLTALGYRGSPGTEVRVVDEQSGAVQASYRIPAGTIVDGIANDGSQLFGFSGTSCGDPLTWYVWNGHTGQLESKTPLHQRSCVPTLYDPTTRRLYVLNQSQIAGTRIGPRTPAVIAYDTTSGKVAGRLPLSGVQAGTWWSGRVIKGYQVPEVNGLGFALSPDGKDLAILDGSADRLLLIDAATLQITKTVSLGPPVSPLARLLGWLGLLPGVAEAKMEQGVDSDVTFSPDGHRLYTTGDLLQVGRQGKMRVSSLPLRVIDTSSGTAIATGPAPLAPWDLQVAPDGSAIYTVGPARPTSNTCPCVLRRLDPATLQVEAQRAMSRTMVGQFFVLAAPARVLTCQPSSQTGMDTKGHAPRASLYALDLVATAGHQTKIVWRMTGTGDLQMFAENAAGTRVTPDWMQQHTLGSSWSRPGDEWGTGWTFPTAGCWRVFAIRETVAGDAWFTVSPA